MPPLHNLQILSYPITHQILTKGLRKWTALVRANKKHQHTAGEHPGFGSGVPHPVPFLTLGHGRLGIIRELLQADASNMLLTGWSDAKMPTKQKVCLCVIAKQDSTNAKTHFWGWVELNEFSKSLYHITALFLILHVTPYAFDTPQWYSL